VNMKRIVITLLIIFCLTPRLAGASNVVYISAVQVTGGVGKSYEDFVELYNPGPGDFALKGVRLVKRTGTGMKDIVLMKFTDNMFIPAGKYVVWTNDQVAGKYEASVSSKGTIAGNNGVGLRLGDENSDKLLTSVAWGKTENGFLNVSKENPQAGQMLVRKADGSYEISGSEVKNEATQSVSQGNIPASSKTEKTNKVIGSKSAEQTEQNQKKRMFSNTGFAQRYAPPKKAVTLSDITWFMAALFGSIILSLWLRHYLRKDKI